MKKIVVITLLMFFASAACAAQKIKVCAAVLRNSKITHCPSYVIDNDCPNVVYQDGQTYIEADVVEVTEAYILFRLLISSADSRGMLMARGMPRLKIPMNNGLGMASLNCDGNDEHFTLIFSASSVD